MKKLVLLLITLFALSLLFCSCTRMNSKIEYQLSDDGSYYILSKAGYFVTDVVIPKTYNGKPIKEIGIRAFADSNLENITIEADIEIIGNQAFKGCYLLEDIILPDSVKYIGNEVFWETDLESIVLPEGLLEIGEGCFKYTDLTSIEIPNSITKIANSTFANCYSLAYIKLPDSLEIIDKSAFDSCTNLKEIEFPTSLKIIGSYAFRGAFALISISLPENLESIGKGAFKACQFKEIHIPASVLTIYESAFSYNPFLEKITVEEGNPNYKIVNDSLISMDGTLLLQYPVGKKDTKYAVPSGVTKIGELSFGKSDSLLEIVLPEGLEIIGSGAFDSCKSLKTIDIPQSVHTIESSAFEFCKQINGITLPQSLRVLGNDVFRSCDSLESIIIPEGIESIEDYTFVNADDLREISVPKSVKYIGHMAFNCENIEVINYSGTIAEWKEIEKNSVWKNILRNFTIRCTDGDISASFSK